MTITALSIRILEDLPAACQPPQGTIGIQGGRGSFNEQAATQFLMQKDALDVCPLKYLYTSDNVAKAVAEGDVPLGQCAISNSIGGDVHETLDALAKYPVQIVATFEIKIAHALMLRADQDLAKIDTIMCHPQVLAQCKQNLAKKYHHLKQTSGEGDLLDSARVAQALSQRQLPDNVAVMGSRMFAELYDLNVVEDNLQDLSENYTRFILLAKKDA